MIVRSFDPFRELDRMAESFRSAPATMAYDAVRRGDEVVVELDLPGVDPSSIDLTVERNHLVVRARRERSTREGDVVLASGRRHGEFRRDLELGASLDARRVSARYDNGVLTLTVPLAESAAPRKIEVEVGRGEGAPQRQLVDTTAG